LQSDPNSLPILYEEVGSLSFRKDFLMSCGVTPSSAKIVNVHGTSMEPTIPNGLVLLVNSANTEPRNGKIFAMAKGHEGLVVKRLIKNGEDWLARSDNMDGNPDFPINDGIPVTIIGRAVWIGTKL
jgi:phage repressor protein C with HTH and peptisase S24 domain